MVTSIRRTVGDCENDEKWISHHCLNSQDRSQWYKNFSLLTLAPWVGVNRLIVIQVERCKENGSSKLQKWGWNGLLSLSPTISTMLSGRALCICRGVHTSTEVQFKVLNFCQKKTLLKKRGMFDWLNPSFFCWVSQEKNKTPFCYRNRSRILFSMLWRPWWSWWMPPPLEPRRCLVMELEIDRHIWIISQEM